MFSIAAMALVLLVTIGLASTMAYLLVKYLGNIPPGPAKMKKEVNGLKASIATWFADLVPWDSDEMEKLSLNQLNNKIQKGLKKQGRGIFTSIYHEPMIAYAFKKYSGKNQVLIYARTSHHEYAFRINGLTTEVWMDDQPLGKIKEDGTLLGARTLKPIARLGKVNEMKALPIVVNDRNLATLSVPGNEKTVNPRAFELLNRMDSNEEAVLLSLAIFEMVKPEIEKV
ncbi:MAG: hypothetical protein R2769_17180 [Saprospiraceae bacterium]